MFLLFLVGAALFLAYANGANDNFKGVATLFGSQVTNYRRAITWATATTMLGSIASVVLAANLVKNFSGKGLVPDPIAEGLGFHGAIALAAGITVILATRLGFPISTTHALTGALVGAGLAASGSAGEALVNFAQLRTAFLLPLLLSPLVAIGCGAILYGLLHQLPSRLGLAKAPLQEACVCVDPGAAMVTASGPDPTGAIALSVNPQPTVVIDQMARCVDRYGGQLWGIQVQPILDGVHFLSAGLVSFARGLNDTPKIVSLMLVSQGLSLQMNALIVGLAIAIGGWLNARRVAETMSQKLTSLNPGQGLSANLVTAALTIAASRWGLPVSTTHVSVGSIFGVGTVARSAHLRVFGQVLLSWVLTLPIAALLSGLIYAAMLPFPSLH
ncbi:MAG: anion permease [Oscillatoriales cyanobacterium]|nr:MAG: anion permease [Oscillatoriales cyanobacterium]